MNAASWCFLFLTWLRTEMRKGVTVVPSSAPIRVATARESGMAPDGDEGDYYGVEGAAAVEERRAYPACEDAARRIPYHEDDVLREELCHQAGRILDQHYGRDEEV